MLGEANLKLNNSVNSILIGHKCEKIEENDSINLQYLFTK